MDEARNIFLLQCRPLKQMEMGKTARPEGQFGKPLMSGGVTQEPRRGRGMLHKVARDMDMLTFPRAACCSAWRPPRAGPRS